MKISAKGRYAIGLMLDLATYNVGDPITLKDIAKRQDIPDKYLEQIVSLMSRAGFVKSTRGAQGGYMLREKPENYTLGMILNETEKELVPSEFDNEDLVRDSLSDEVLIRIHTELNNAIKQVLDNVTLADMLEWQSNSWGGYSI